MSKIDNAMLGAFTADAYCLGSHWIYDDKQLAALPIDWESLSDPQAMWHEGKKAGDFTHYGDHTLWLVNYLKKHKTFDAQSFAQFWKEQMQDFKGYVDGSSRDTLAHLNANQPADCGPANHDLSICGRIAPLLSISENRQTFTSLAVMFAKVTHNDPTVLEAVHFFASLLWDVIEGKDLTTSIEALKSNYSPMIQTWADEGLASKCKNSFETIRAFGPACGVEGGFAGTIHLLVSFTDFKEAITTNAKAGGDSSSRGMIVGMIFGALGYKIPQSWIPDTLK